MLRPRHCPAVVKWCHFDHVGDGGGAGAAWPSSSRLMSGVAAPSSVAGALLGLAAGDVLGSGLEGLSRQQARRTVGDRLMTPLPGSCYTDDTQQAMVLAYHLLGHDRIDPERLARELLALARPLEHFGVYRGYGPGFRAFVEHLAAGSSYREAAQPSAGNGAAMRVAPVAMRFFPDRDRLTTEALVAATVTHADRRGVAAACAMAVAVAAAAAGERGRDLVYASAEAAAQAERRLSSEPGLRGAADESRDALSNALLEASPLVGEPPDRVADRVGERAASSSATGSQSGTAPYALASVVTSIVLAARPDDEPFEPMRRAVALGGDTDTVGAMTGAIIGARLGIVEWPWEIPNAALFAEVGRRLVEGGDAEELPDLYQVEAAVCSR
ncbi:MAG: ADP-ribosylglycohydrolase family protein [Acidimicrobiia bacterium]